MHSSFVGLKSQIATRTHLPRFTSERRRKKNKTLKARALPNEWVSRNAENNVANE